jgi:hypothetical protein
MNNVGLWRQGEPHTQDILLILVCKRHLLLSNTSTNPYTRVSIIIAIVPILASSLFDESRQYIAAT